MRHHLGLLLALAACNVPGTVLAADDPDARGAVALGQPALDPMQQNVVKLTATPTLKAGQPAGWTNGGIEACYFVQQGTGYTGIVNVATPPAVGNVYDISSTPLANGTYDIWVIWKFIKLQNGVEVDSQRIGSAFTVSPAINMANNPIGPYTIGGRVDFDNGYPLRDQGGARIRAKGSYWENPNPANPKWLVDPTVGRFSTIPIDGGLVREATAAPNQSKWEALFGVWVPSSLTYNTYESIRFNKNPNADPQPDGAPHYINAIKKNQ